VVVCDAETDDDLRAIADASLGHPAITAFAGSAGLSSQIPQAIGVVPDIQRPEWDFAPGPTLFVIGSAASVTRQQARFLEAIPEIATFHATPAVLHNMPIMQSEIMQCLQSRRDALFILDRGELCSNYGEQFLSLTLSDLLSNCAQFLGGLVATGGETARAALDALGIRRLRLLSEVEAGLPLSVADGWVRPLPVITKAGAFGSPQSLIRCRQFLRELERVPARLHSTHPLLHHES
jgi:4-hydroxythreonine-4-phosphate dehydrogenase